MTTPVLPIPPAFGFSADQFPNWRPGQAESVVRVIDDPARISVECQPTGAGKTLIAQAVGKIAGLRTVVLTRRRGLQTQIVNDFRIHDVRGQSNYQCMYSPNTTVDLGPCHVGMSCHYRTNGCMYYDAVKEFTKTETRISVTNYAFWFTRAKNGENVGSVDLLVCDEAHGVLDELSQFLTITIHRSDIERRGITWPEWYGNSLSDWVSWARAEAFPKLSDILAEMKESVKLRTPKASDVREIRGLENMISRIGSLKDAKGRWVCDLSIKGGTLTASPIWPGDYLETYLFRGIKKILMTSATIRPKALNLLNLNTDQFTYREIDSPFPLDRRPVICVESPRMNFRISEGDKALWLDRIDQCLDRRSDRNVIIHVGSYDRRNYIMTRSRHGSRMIGHGPSDIDDAIRRFKTSSSPLVLVSQSMTEGYDFPYSSCETQIIAKVPYPDSRDVLVQARRSDDKEYTDFIAMQGMVQAAGRAMRAEDDRCETLVVDGNAKWFMSRYAHYAPEWFNKSVRQMSTIPEPPERINRR